MDTQVEVAMVAGGEVWAMAVMAVAAAEGMEVVVRAAVDLRVKVEGMVEAAMVGALEAVVMAMVAMAAVMAVVAMVRVAATGEEGMAREKKVWGHLVAVVVAVAHQTVVLVDTTAAGPSEAVAMVGVMWVGEEVAGDLDVAMAVEGQVREVEAAQLVVPLAVVQVVEAGLAMEVVETEAVEVVEKVAVQVTETGAAEDLDLAAVVAAWGMVEAEEEAMVEVVAPVARQTAEPADTAAAAV